MARNGNPFGRPTLRHGPLPQRSRQRRKCSMPFTNSNPGDGSALSHPQPPTEWAARSLEARAVVTRVARDLARHGIAVMPLAI